jgi:hypothetical protein
MKILSIKERKDGSADMVYELNKSDEKLFRQMAKQNKVRFSKKFCNQLILNALQNYIGKE